MLKRTLFVLGLAAILVALFSVLLFADGPPTRFVVVFKNNLIPPDAEQLVETAGGRLVKTFPKVGVGIAVSENPDFASSLGNSTLIESVSPERTRTLPERKTPALGATAPIQKDDLFASQWNIRRVRADKAWEITTGSHRTVVAVIDGGIAWNHPDLNRNVVFRTCFSSKGLCSDYPDDPCQGSHGTNVAGIIAASFGGGSLVGVGPNLGLASYNVFEDSGEPDPFGCPGTLFIAQDSSVWSAMLDAAERSFRVINISLGDLVVRPDDAATIIAWDRVVSQVIKDGVTIVASAGNEATNLDGPVDHIPSDLPGVISVGATGIRPEPLFPQKGAFDVLAFYSNFGRPIDLVAPGGDFGPQCDFTSGDGCITDYLIMTTDVFPIDAECAAAANCPVDYFPSLGTSLSAPHVAGAAGLILDRHPYLSPFEVTLILKLTARRIGDTDLFGSGMLDVYRALGGH